MLLSKCVKEYLKEYRTEYEKYIDFRRREFHEDMELPNDEYLLCVALINQTETMKALNMSNEVVCGCDS